MYCSKCGIENSAGATYCVNCGAVLINIQSESGPVMATPPAAPKTSGLAVASLVMGLMCMTCVLWPFLVLPAIICGIIALVKISGQRGALRGTGMAVTGIVIPTVMILFIPIFAMLAGILMPALAKTKHIAQRVVCNTNVKGLATAMIVYQNDYDDKFPTPNNWCDLLIQEADVSPKSFQCPLDCEGAYSYAVNKGLYTIETDKLPAQMVMLFESNLGKNAAGGLSDVVLRHNEHGQCGCNIAFANGHVEFVTKDRIPDLLWEAE